MSLINDVLKKIDQQNPATIAKQHGALSHSKPGFPWYKKPLFWIGFLLSCFLATSLVWGYLYVSNEGPGKSTKPLPLSDTMAQQPSSPSVVAQQKPSQVIEQKQDARADASAGADTSVVAPLVSFTLKQQQQFLYHKAYQAAVNHNWDQVAALLQNSKLPLTVQQAPYKQVAVALFKQKQYDSAILAAKHGLSNHDDSELYMIMAQSYLEQDMTLEAYDTLASHRPSLALYPQFYGLLANIQLQLKHYQDAQQTYHQLAMAFPNESRWWLGLAMSAQKNQDQKLAYHAYQQALDLGHMKQGIKRYIQNQIRTLQA